MLGVFPTITVSGFERLPVHSGATVPDFHRVPAPTNARSVSRRALRSPSVWASARVRSEGAAASNANAPRILPSGTPLMVLGTASDVGKSLIVTALCRHFARRGLRVAPFKAQNMALNSAATPDGREIGRAQALQAEAAGVAPSVDMNPVLLKPTSDTGSQVVLQGRVFGTFAAREYRTLLKDTLFPRVMESYARLAAANDVIVIEGAGSPAEINLREGDIVNMGMAHAAGTRCLLVGDIDRGGVFAALLGTLELLDARDRARIAAFAINKFRGDRALLQPGIDAIEPRLGIPCAGVIPHLREIGLDEEDSVALERRRDRPWRSAGEERLRIAVVQLPYLSNFTDFDALEAEPSVDLRYVRRPDDLAGAHLIVIPGTKSTIADLGWLRASGMADVVAASERSALVFGICGGLQMLGTRIDDPHHVEGGGSAAGLGLLPVHTVLARDKTTRTVRGRANATIGVGTLDATFGGYEIHMGESTYGDAPAFAFIGKAGEDPHRDGAVSHDGTVAGSYVHGMFAQDAFRHAYLRTARAALGLPAMLQPAFVERERQGRIDRVASEIVGALSFEPWWDGAALLRS